MKHLSRALGCAVLVSLVLAGCSGQQDEGSGDSEPDQAASSSSPEEPDTSAAAASEEPTPTIAPATGDTISVEGMEVKLPAHWKPGPASSLQASGWEEGNARSFVTLFRFSQGLVKSLDEQARFNATRTDWATALKRREDLAVDSQVVTHLSGEANPGMHIDLFTTLRNQELLQLEFRFAAGESKAERDEIVQSMLATWEFTSPG